MPFYRGIAQEDIVKSINNAIDLLTTHSTGIECKKMLSRLTTAGENGQSPLEIIAKAKDDKALTEAVSVSGAAGVFSQLRDLLQYHAHADTAGKGGAVYDGLAAWDGMSAATFAVYTPLNEEIDSWLAAAYAKHIPFTAENTQKITQFLDALGAERRSSPDAIQMAKDGALMFVEQAALGDAKSIRQSFKEMDLHERHLMTLALQVHSGLFDAPRKAPSALSGYGIHLGALAAQVNLHDPSVEALRLKMDEVLTLFYEADEVTRTGLGMITEDRKEVGIMFVATRRAAEAVAAAMPDQTILDYKGQRVLPPGTPAMPKNGGFKL
jgi:hypothetical protein